MKLKSMDALMKKHLSKEEMAEIDRQVRLEILTMEALQTDLAKAVNKYMEKEDIGFNELIRRLGISPTHLAKIQKGTANLTLSSIARLASVIGGVYHLVLKVQN